MTTEIRPPQAGSQHSEAKVASHGAKPSIRRDRVLPILSLFTDHDDMCFWQMSLSDQTLDFPENAYNFFGVDVQALPKTAEQWLSKLVVEEDRPDVRRRLFRSNDSCSYIERFSFRISRGDGTFRWIEQRGAVSGRGTKKHVTWLSQDVTDKLQTADSLDTTKKTLQQILEQSDVGMVLLTVGGGLRYCNNSFCKMVGYSHAELIGKPISLLVGPDLPHSRKAQLVRLLNKQATSFRGEFQLIAKSGNRVWVDSSLWHMPTSEDLEPVIFGMVIPIDERLDALKLLRQERDAFKAVFENADIGLALTNGDGKMMAMNPAALRTFGLKNSRDMKERFKEPGQHYAFHTPDGQELERWQWPGARANRGDYVNDLDLILARKRTADRRHVKYTCIPVRNAKGEVFLHVYSINDVTDIRRLYEALSQSQRLEAVGRLAGGIAHDFNNILTVIAGNLELIEQVLPHDQARARLMAARDAAEAGINLNRRLLTIARKRLPQRKTVDVVKRMRGMVQLLERTIGHAIALHLELPHQPCFANVDPGDLDAAFLNLVTNARDALSQGGDLFISVAEIRMTGTPGSAGRESNQQVLLRIRDTGAGMSAQTLQMAAEPFFTTKPSGKGTGLGLTGVYAFAHECGGRVEINSELGKGTEVCLFIPSVKAPEVDYDDASEVALPYGAGELVLAVEDDPAVREITCERLYRLGYEVAQAADGEKALALIENGMRPACVLTDIHMPGKINGVDLAERVEALCLQSRTVLCTGYHDVGQTEGWVRTGTQCTVLTKPYSLSQLANALHEAISAGRASAGAGHGDPG